MATTRDDVRSAREAVTQAQRAARQADKRLVEPARRGLDLLEASLA